MFENDLNGTFSEFYRFLKSIYFFDNPRFHNIYVKFYM